MHLSVCCMNQHNVYPMYIHIPRIRYLFGTMYVSVGSVLWVYVSYTPGIQTIPSLGSFLSVCCVLYVSVMYTTGTHTMPLYLSACHWVSAINTPGMHTIPSSRVTVSQWRELWVSMLHTQVTYYPFSRPKVSTCVLCILSQYDVYSRYSCYSIP